MKFNNSLVVMGIFTLMLGLVLMGNGSAKNTLNCSSHSYNLKALKDSKDTEGYLSGSFFLGIGGISGSTEQELNYYFYMHDGGGFVPRKAAMDQVRIVEDSDRAYVIRSVTDIKGDGKDPCESHGNGSEDGNGYKFFYEFHIPSNSIKEGYTLDLE